MTAVVDAAAPCRPTPALRRPALMWWPFAFRSSEFRLPPGLSRAQLEDAGIPLERAGFGRSADVQGLAVTVLESLR